MKCVDCRFHLLCHSGCLDQGRGEVSLCMRCSRLHVALANDKQELFVLDCEKRSIIDVRRMLRKAEEGPVRVGSDYSNANFDGHQVREYLVPDPGPGLKDKLRAVHECVICAGMASRWSMTIIDLDAALALEREEAPSVVALDFRRDYKPIIDRKKKPR